MMKVLVVYHYIAKYRQPIFDALISSKRVDFYIASDIVSNTDIELVSDAFYDQSKFIRLHNTWLGKGLLWQKGIFSLIRSGKFDAVIFLGDPNFLSTWIAIVLNALYKTKTVLWTHGFVHGHSWKDKLKLIMYRLSDGLFLYGDSARKNLIARGVTPQKLVTIYNSLDYNRQRDLRQQISNQELATLRSHLFMHSGLQIVFVGRLTLHKRLEMVLSAISTLRAKGYEINLLFVGDGAARSKLEEITNGDPLLRERVHFHGKTYNEEQLCKLIMCSDVCVSPGEVGLTAMHVLAYGIPVITHRCEFRQMPEFEAIIDGYTGMLFDYDSVKSLANALEHFIESPIPHVSENCINMIEEKYNPDKQTNLIEDGLHAIARTN